VRFFNKPKNGMEASHKKCRYELPAAVNQLFYYEVRVMPYETHIEDNDLDDKVKLLLSVHDQQVSEVREDYAAQWAITQTELMEKLLCYTLGSFKSRIRHHGPLDQRINKQP
jgi:type II secretory pathway predicted ATPase ExeA